MCIPNFLIIQVMEAHTGLRGNGEHVLSSLSATPTLAAGSPSGKAECISASYHSSLLASPLSFRKALHSYHLP